MNYQVHAATVIVKRRLTETLISPGFYITQTIGLLLGYLLVNGFISSVDSSGFVYTLNPAYDLIGRILSGAFGSAFVNKLFSEGPFLFILYVSCIPILLYLSVSSVFRFGLEKQAGAIELLCYGPADGTAYFLASLVKDVIMMGLYLAVLYLFLLVTGMLNNLVLGTTFYHNLFVLFFLSASIFSYGILASTVTDNSSSAIALFSGIMIFFAVVMLGSFMIVGGYVRNVATVIAWIIQWVSPLFYWDLALRSMEAGSTAMYLLGMVLLLVLTVIILGISHMVMKIRGVRS